MRLICSIRSKRDVKIFSLFLVNKKIQHKLEVAIGPEGEAKYQIWVVNEEDFEKANEWYEKFLEDPKNPIFKVSGVKLYTVPKPQKEKKKKNKYKKITPQFTLWKSSGRATLFILMLCITLFIWDEVETFNSNSNSGYSTIKKSLMYNYNSLYPTLVKAKIMHLVTWQGFYERVVDFLKKRPPKEIKVPPLEKISKGQIWRLFTPALLHGGLLHLVFNMSWLLFLGNQIELRTGLVRYLIFIVLAGIFSNTAQYLMSGDQFLGFSGVICAMIAFVWLRQHNFPWEGYFMPRSAFVFVSFFILLMVGIQLVSFMLEVTGKSSGPIIPIGNTAHLSGALAGAIMAKIPFFKRM